MKSKRNFVQYLLFAAIITLGMPSIHSAFGAETPFGSSNLSPNGHLPWSPMQATGKPDAEKGHDVPTAWASYEPDSGVEWLELEFGSGVIPKAIHVHESHAPGALTKITIFNDEKEEVAWQGVDPIAKGQLHGIANIPLNGIKFRVAKLRLYIDARKVSGWNEIDAVALIDSKAKQHWAVKAKASTTYAKHFSDLPSQAFITQSTIETTTKKALTAGRMWGAEQAAGEPNTPNAGDYATAWASLTQDDNEEWLVAKYAKATNPAAVVIHESYNPGAVVHVSVFDEKGKEVRVWSGVDPTPPDAGHGVSTIPLKVDFKIDQIKIYLDSKTIKGWNEIDAIGLKDSAGKIQWAQSVKASSTYATYTNSTRFVYRGSLPISIKSQPVSEIERLKKENDALRKQIAELKEALDQAAKKSKKSSKK